MLEKDEYKDVEIYPNEVDIIYTKDSGPGGQHRNKTESCVIMTHYATGIQVKEAGKDQHKNKREAFKRMKRRVNQFYKTGHSDEIEEVRREQVGSGDCSDKRRTYRVQEGMIDDHLTGKSCSFKQFMKGNLELLC